MIVLFFFRQFFWIIIEKFSNPKKKCPKQVKKSWDYYFFPKFGISNRFASPNKQGGNTRARLPRHVSVISDDAQLSVRVDSVVCFLQDPRSVGVD